jgi:DNA-binding transcriptional ArsR family regulator
MISYVATADDISRLRFGVSPVGEAVCSIRMMASASKRLAHQRWVSEVRPRLGGVDFRPLRALIPSTGYVPDFLTPPPAPGEADFGAHLEVVRSTNPQELVDDTAWMMNDPGTPGRWRAATALIHRKMLAEPERALATVVDLLAVYWRLALEPHWQRMHGGLHADIRNRMRVIESSGTAAMFSSLNQRVGWQGDRLSVRSSYEFEEPMGGQGLVLVPSIFCGPEVLTMVPPLQPMVVYPQAGASQVWTSRGAGHAQPLTLLLGGVRAAVLEAVATPTSTSELATQIGVTPGAVSQHLGVLRECGLITSRRAGRRMVHSLTTVGEDLLHSAQITSRTWFS